MEKKIINYRYTQEYQALVCDISAALCEETKTIIFNSQEESLRRLKARHEMAKEIISHPAYQKFAKNNSEFIENFRKDIKREIGDKVERIIGKSSLYDALALYEKEPDFKKMVGRLGERVSLTRALQVYLGREDSRLGNNSCRTCPDCKHCPKHARP